MIRVGLISFLMALCFFQEGVAGWCFGKSPSKCTTLEYAAQYTRGKCFRIKECERVFKANHGTSINDAIEARRVGDIERRAAKTTPARCEQLKKHVMQIEAGLKSSGFQVLHGAYERAGKEHIDVDDFNSPPYAACRTSAFLDEMTIKDFSNAKDSSTPETLKACLSEGCRDALIETMEASNRVCKQNPGTGIHRVRCRIMGVSDSPWGAATERQ